MNTKSVLTFAFIAVLLGIWGADGLIKENKGENSHVIRNAIESDAEGIYRIYNYEVENTSVTLQLPPFSISSIKALLQEFSSSKKYPFIVCEQNGEILGWARLFPFSERGGYTHTAEIGIYVDRKITSRGIGTLLAKHLLANCKNEGICSVLAKITNENEKSVKFHEKIGFSTVGIMKKAGFKFGVWSDVRIMQLMI